MFEALTKHLYCTEYIKQITNNSRITAKSNNCDPVLPEEFYGWINQVGSWGEEGLFQILKKKITAVNSTKLSRCCDIYRYQCR